MTEADLRVIVEQQRGDDVRWWALLVRRLCLTAVQEIERRFDLPRSIIPAKERRQ